MAVAIRGTTPSVATSTTATVSTTLTGARQPQAGDLLVIIHFNDYYLLSNMPTPTVAGSTAGVTAVTNGTADAGSTWGHAKSYTYAVASTGDLTVAVTETGSADEEKALAVYVLSGADTASPIDGGAAGAAATFNTASMASHVLTGVTPSGSDAFLIGHDASGNGASTAGYTTPGNETYDAVFGGMSYVGFVEQLSASGATGTRTVTPSGSINFAALILAVKTGSAAAPEKNYAGPYRGPAPGRISPTGEWRPQPPGPAKPDIIIAIGVAAETDSAQPLGRLKARTIGIASEAAAAQTVGRAKTKALGVASGTDTALALGRRHSRSLGIAGETDTAPAVGRAKARTLGIAAAADSALPLGRSKVKPLGIASETDTAQGVTAPVATRRNLCPNPAAGTNLTGWSNNDATLTRVTGLTGFPSPVTTGAHHAASTWVQTPECVAAPGQTVTASFYLSNNVGLDQNSKTIYLAFTRSAGGTDFSNTTTASYPTGAVTRGSITATAPADTIGAYLVIDGISGVLGGGIDVSAVLYEATGTLGSYFDGDTAGAHWDGTPDNSTSTFGPMVLGVASETDTALAVGRTKVKALGVAAETDAALPLGRSKARALGPATESDAALPVTAALVVPPAFAGPWTGMVPGWRSPTGQLTPQPFGSFQVANITAAALGAAAETDSAQPVGRAKARTVGIASETDTTVAAGRAKRRLIGIAAETDTALTSSRVKSRTLGIASTTDTAVAAGHTKRRLIGSASETDTALTVSRPGHLFGAVNTAAETDTAQPITRSKRRTLGVATTVDAALAMGRRKARALGTAAETDAPGAVHDPDSIPVGTALEVDTVPNIIRGRRWVIRPNSGIVPRPNSGIVLRP